MGQGIIGNMWVCPVIYIPVSGTGLQIYIVGVTKWQALAGKTDASGHIEGVKTQNAGFLKRYMWSVDAVLERVGTAVWGRILGSRT